MPPGKSAARSAAGLLLLLLAGWRLADVSPACGSDWPQFRGPARDGISQEKDWLTNWPAGKPPRVAWRVDVGKGHSTTAVVGDRVYTMGWDGVRDAVYCIDAATGKTLWKQTYPCQTIVQWPGPRATPTVHEGTVYTLGQHGQLRAHQAEDGKLVWAVQLDAAYKPDDDYGFAWSPLIQGDLLILPAGSKGLAVRRKDGSIAWGDDHQRGACASPVPFKGESGPGVAVITTNSDREAVTLVGVNPANGEVLWRHGPWKEKWGAACVDLLIDRGKVFITTSEQHKQSARFSIDGKKLKEDWATSKFNSYTGGCVLEGNCIYGVSQRGMLTCIDWATGEVKWSQRDFDAHGSLIAADGKLIVQTGRRGDLVIVAADPAGYKELRRVRVFKDDPATFTAPSMANGRIYCRSYAGELVCLDLR